MESAESSSPSALDYATPSTNQRVRFFRTEAGATVVIEDSERRANAVAGVIGRIVAQLIVVGLMGGIYLYFWAKEVGFVLIASIVVALLTIVGFLSWLHYRKLSQPIVIELTATELIFSNLDEKPARKYPRDRVYAIKYVSHSKNLVVRARGCEMFEHRFSLSPAQVEEIATFLRNVCGLDTGATS